MKLMVTNDDGYLSPGLRALESALDERFEVYTLAPKCDQSGQGSALTLGKRLPDIHATGKDKIFYMDSTPADCAYVGINSVFFGGDIEMIVSGINFGDNMTTDIFSSGTIGAAIQGVHLDFPPMAISLAANKHKDPFLCNFATAAAFAGSFVRFMFESKMKWKKGIFFNVNVPDLPTSQVKGMRWTRPALRGRSGMCMGSPDGGFFIGKRGKVATGSHTDVAAVEAGYISISPLSTYMSCDDPRESLYDRS